MHQLVVIGLYFLASAVAWQIKEWQAGIGPALIFGLVGIAATAAGVFRGHLLFTERLNPDGLAAERLRTDRVTSAIDLLIAAALVAGAAFISARRPLAAVLTAGLAVGIGLARLVVEPSTAAASFRRS
jgi:hypothetical protein